MELVNKNQQVIKTYKVMLGKNSTGHKMQEGDQKTPEGEYLLDAKNPQSNYYKSLHISYPNPSDQLKARALRVNPGADIMLHGYPNYFKKIISTLEDLRLGGVMDYLISYFDWTNGCIAVSNKEIDEIYNLVDVPTKIIIAP